MAAPLKAAHRARDKPRPPTTHRTGFSARHGLGMALGKRRLRFEIGQDGLPCCAVATDAEILIGVEIPIDPIIHAQTVIPMDRAPTIGLLNKAFQFFQPIMVQLPQAIIVSRKRGKQALGLI